MYGKNGKGFIIFFFLIFIIKAYRYCIYSNKCPLCHAEYKIACVTPIITVSSLWRHTKVYKYSCHAIENIINIYKEIL